MLSSIHLHNTRWLVLTGILRTEMVIQQLCLLCKRFSIIAKTIMSLIIHLIICAQISACLGLVALLFCGTYQLLRPWCQYYTHRQHHSGILGFMTLVPTENENILVFEKSKWIRKQKLTSNIGYFLRIFFQLILTTRSQNRSPAIIVYYGIWARVSTNRAVALFSDVVHTT